MADMLAAPADLNALLDDPVDATLATLLIETATAVVQRAAGGQRIVLVADDVLVRAGSRSSWFDLPQRPVVSVASVTLDGAAVTAGPAGSGGTTYRRVGNRLWRGDGWQTYCGEPSEVRVVYTHGLDTTDQDIQLARDAVLGLSVTAAEAPGAIKAEQIGSYRVSFDAVEAALTDSLAASLAAQYGRRAGLVRIG